MSEVDLPIVIRALSAEYIRVRNKMAGAQRRLKHALKQVEIETDMAVNAKNELGELAKVILDHDGVLPVDAEGEEPYVD